MFINKVEITGVNTSKLPVLTNEEKNELLEKVKQGDLKAREEFINANLRLVLSILQRINPRGENIDDIFQIGCVGLIKAIDNFDISLNVQFSTYAVPMIIGEIRRYLRDNTSIRVSRSIRDLSYRIMMIKERCAKENLKEPTIEELAKELGVEKEDIVVSLDAIQMPISLQEPIYSDSGDNVYIEDQIKDKKNTEDIWASNITIKDSLKKLNERERKIVEKRFFDGRTQIEVAEELGISQAQVSRLEKSAIKTIRRYY